MATWAIGDVHGCYKSLRALLARKAIGATDRLWFVGDLVNRGPRSLEVLRFVADLGERATVVLGNHDLHFLGRAAGVVEPRGRDRLDALLAAPDVDELASWLAARPLVHGETGRLLVHAGVARDWGRREAERRARRLQAVLAERSLARCRAYLSAYRPGAARPRGVSGELIDDLRVMTLMRTVDEDGEPTYDYTGPLDALPRGRWPWFDEPGRKSRRFEIVCGHWAALGLVVRHDLVAVDTGCAWGGALTAVRLGDRRVEQVQNRD